MNVHASLGRALVGLVVIGATLGFSGGTVFAHVEVARTEPADGSVLTSSPSNITLSFTDDLTLDLASVELRTASGTRIELTPIAFGGSHRQLVVLVPTLADDAYRLSYDVRDPVDLHETSGSLVFGVGTTPAIGGGTDSQGAKLGDSMFGWTARGGLALVVGGVAMVLIIRLRPRRSLEPNRFVDTSISVVRFGAITVLVGEMASLISQVLDIGGTPASTAWRVLVRSSYGHRFLITAALVLGLLRFLTIVRPLLLRSNDSSLGIAETGSAMIALGLIVVAAFASHAGIGGAFALGVVLRVGHLGGMGVWIGGLVVLVVARRRFGAAACADVLRSFSPVAVASVALTVATGLLLSGREVTSLTALFSTGFGGVLIVKLGLVGCALLLGARHATAVRRGRPVRSITVALEAGLALAVVLGGAALATAAPAVGERFDPAVEVLPTNASDKSDDLLVRLTIGPSRPGRNLVRVEFIDSRKPAPAPPESATVEMTNASGEVVSRSGGPPVNGIIDLQPADITAPGPLRVTVRIERSSRPISPLSFNWTIGPTTVPRARTVVSDQPLAPFTAAAAVCVVVLAAAGLRVRRRRRRPRIDNDLGGGTPRKAAATQSDARSQRSVGRSTQLSRRSFSTAKTMWHDVPRTGAAFSQTECGEPKIGTEAQLKARKLIGGQCRNEQSWVVAGACSTAAT